jgi:hypothetical protein
MLSERESSPGSVRVCSRSFGGSTLVALVVPHATRDFKTATRHSRLRRFRCGSVVPKLDVSTPPVPASAFVLSAGGTAFPLGFVCGGRPGLDGSLFLGGTCEIGAVANLEIMLMKLRASDQRAGVISENKLTARRCCLPHRCHSRSLGIFQPRLADPDKASEAC